MSNRTKGDVTINLAGQDVLLRPTFEGMLAMEEQLGMGIVGLTARMGQGDIGFKNVTALIFGGLIGSGHKEEVAVGARKITRALTYREVGERVRQTGIYRLSGPAKEFLVECLRSEMPDPAEKSEGKVGPQSAGESQAAAE